MNFMDEENLIHTNIVIIILDLQPVTCNLQPVTCNL